MKPPALFDFLVCVAMISFVAGASIGAVCGTNDTPIFHAEVNVSGAVTGAVTGEVMTHTAHAPDDEWSQRRGVIMLGW